MGVFKTKVTVPKGDSTMVEFRVVTKNSDGTEEEKNAVLLFADGNDFVLKSVEGEIRCRRDPSTFVIEYDGAQITPDEAKTLVAKFMGDDGEFSFSELFSSMFLTAGSMYSSGKIRSAAAGWNFCAAFGNARAMYELGVCLRDGELGERDPEGAFKCFLQGAEQGNAPCMREVAICYEEGFGTKKDDVEAEKWNGRAREQGDVIALFNAFMNRYDSDPAWIDTAKRVVELGSKEVKPSLDHPSDFSQIYSQDGTVARAVGMCATALGIAYYDGNGGVEKNLDEAFKYTRIGAEYGQPVAMEGLSLYYEKGEGCQADASEARTWGERAAKKYRAGSTSNSDNNGCAGISIVAVIIIVIKIIIALVKASGN